MVEITYENVAPILGLVLIAATVYGGARKFTEMQKDITNDQEKNQHDITILEDSVKRLQTQIDSIRHDVKEMHTIVTRLEQKVQDRLNSNSK